MKQSGSIAPVLAAAMLTSVWALNPIALVGAAQAQDQTPAEDSVLTRKRPEFDPIGVRAGSFLIFPQLRASTSFDDNIFATDQNEEDDIVFGIQPSITARSQWARHAFNLRADADVGIFLDNDKSNYEDFGLGLDGRIDVVGESAIRYRGNIRLDHEDRDAPDEAGDEDNTDLIDGGFALSYRHVINRLFIQPGIAVRRRDFDDVGNTNNDDRDFWRYAPSLRVGYALSPGIAIFAGAEFNQVVYDETPNDSGVDRDSEGFALSIGSEFDLTGKLLGEIQIGYQSQEFDDSDLDDFSGINADGSLTFNVTPLTAFVLNLGAGLQETTVSLNGQDASANFRTDAGIELIHELKRNVILRAEGSYIRDDFEGINRTDDRFQAGAGVRYSLNRNLALDLDYTYSTRDSDVDGVDFDRNVIMGGLTARF